jgi:hypothetical protein
MQNNQSFQEVSYAVDFGEEIENFPPENQAELEEESENESDEESNGGKTHSTSDELSDVGKRESIDDEDVEPREKIQDEDDEVEQDEENMEENWGMETSGNIDELSLGFAPLETFDPRRASLGSCASSAPLPRDEVLSILQEKTLQALQYQLFDRLNNGDFEEVSLPFLPSFLIRSLVANPTEDDWAKTGQLYYPIETRGRRGQIRGRHRKQWSILPNHRTTTRDWDEIQRLPNIFEKESHSLGWLGTEIMYLGLRREEIC